MRVLLAYDGSRGGEQALRLAEALPWPGDSGCRVVGVLEQTATTTTAFGGPLPSPELDRQIVSYIEGAVADAVARLKAVRLTDVEGSVVRGRPGSVLVDEAVRSRADLVIAGSRGHGTIASLVLGSVSSELVDHAPCPVLVARRPSVTRIVLASDGSAPAAAAEEVVAWPIFAGVPVEIVSIADVTGPWHSGIAPGMHEQAIAAHAEDVRQARAAAEEVVEAVRGRVDSGMRAVEARVREGDAAAEIIATAEESGADLIVIGSRGQTGIRRMLLGSVARNVLHGSSASVLIVRDTNPATDGER